MGGDMDDIAYVLVYNPGCRQFYGGVEGLTRKDGIAVFDVTGDECTTLHAWIFFVDQQRKRASPTVYIPIA